MKSTFGRALSTVAILLLAALLLIGISFRVLVEDYLTKEAVTGLENDGQIVADLVQAAYVDNSISTHDFRIALALTYSLSGIDAVVCDAKGTLLMCAHSPLGCEHQGLVIGDTYLKKVFSSGGFSYNGMVQGLYTDLRYVSAKPILEEGTGKHIGMVLVSKPMAETISVLTKLSEIYTFVAIFAVIVAGILMTIFFRQQSAPLRDVARTAHAFGHGDLTARVKMEGNYSQEIEELGLAFNNMASSLQKSEYQRREFVANVSHELKTPMTTIAGYVDGILDGTIPPERSRQYLQIVSDETKRLNRLVRSMLDISRLQDEGGVPEEQKTRFDLEECAGQVLITFEQKITGKNIDVQVDMPEYPVYTQANPDAITQVIYNLVDNAVKFCPEGGRLSLTVREGGGKAYISVTNDGPTIPPEELPLVFDRFHKIDKSRSQNRDSWGLGLYIVKTIVDAHGENISVTSRDGMTTFTFTLPLVN